MSDECTVKVMAGACKMNTVVKAKMNDDMMSVTVTLESDCPMVMKSPVPVIMPWEEMGRPMNESAVYEWASKNISHTACPVPMCVLKAVEAAGGMGIKRSPEIEII
ncbi:MAG: hypothetical protein IJ856_07425 [Candidatus Methanomethylophilaceae archaeon]|nr:hypothetical protein [Candidatus Methanomethylophilaceae archaeon]